MVQSFEIILRDGKLHIEGFPEAVAVKGLHDSTAIELETIALHRSDLEFCQAAFARLQGLERKDDPLVADALWFSCMARFFKCFGNSKSRSRLSSTEALRGHQGADKVFDYFKDLRDKHLIHDENPYSHAAALLILNRQGAKAKVANVLVNVITSCTTDPEHFRSFGKLLETTIQWVDRKQEELLDRLIKEYERWKYDDLLALPGSSYTAPRADDVKVTRRRSVAADPEAEASP